MKVFRLQVIAFLLALILSAVTLQAQEATGRVLGTVTDPQSAVVPDAEIKVTEVTTLISHQIKTDGAGNYQVLALPVGTYQVQVNKVGFKPVLISGQHLEINQSLRVNIALEVGTENTTVQVEGNASQVETVNPTLGDSVTSRPIVDMPLNGRNVLDLALLQPGVTDTDNPSNTTFQDAETPHFSIAGGREDSVTYLLDGGNNNNLLDNDFVFNPNPDAVEEFRVLESDYTAEYGRNGGGIVSVVTKSGTNSLHGSLFDFLRNDALDANSFLNNRFDLPRQDLKRNQFGGTVGGPIVKDKLFFFLAYQGQRQTELQTPADTISGATELQTVFTPAELNGDFSQAGPNGGPDPGVACFLTGNFPDGSPCGTDANGNLTGQPGTAYTYFQPNPALGAQAIIDPTKIDPAVQKMITAGLVPSSPTGQLLSQGLATEDNDEITTKFDLNFTPNDRVQLTLGANQSRDNRPFVNFSTIPGYPDKQIIQTRFANLSYTKTFSPTVLNVVRLTFQRLRQHQGVPGVTLPSLQDLGFTGIHPDYATGPPDIELFDNNVDFGLNYGGPAIITNNTYGYSDDLTWTKGKHNWKFGFFFSPYQNNQVYDFIPNGIFTFQGVGGFFTQNVEADFLLGLPNSYQQGPNAPSNIRTKSYAGYGQDEWHANKKLVLTLGLRYEYNTPKTDTEGRTYSIIPGLQSTVFPNAPPGIVFPGDKGAPTGVNFPDRNDFAPRVGFAFDPTGSGKTSIRGGFGVFYDILKAEDNFQFNGTAPFYATAFFNLAPLNGNPTSQPTLFSDPFSYANGSPVPNPFPSPPVDHNVNFGDAGFLPWSPVSTVDPHLRTPYTYQYNLSIQHDLGHNLSAEGDYVGNNSHGLTGLQDINPFIPGSNPANRVLDALPGTDPVSAAIPTYSYIQEFRNIGIQNYNSLQLALRKAVGNTRVGQVYFTFGYTYAHDIDNVSGFRQRTSVVPAFNPLEFRANSDIDIRHRITFSGGWDLPFDRLGGPKLLTKGWSLYPIVSYRTGFPLDILNTYVTDLSDPGPSGLGDGALVRANLIGNSVQILNPRSSQNFANLQYLDPSNFGFGPGSVASGYGTLGRNSVPGPSRFNTDLSLAKTTQITERVSAELRAEFFNIFNSAQWETVDTFVGDPSFGQILQTYAPRIGQLALRIRF
jgi:Carboxypeptidase regulatory-like domain/TonB dependent receptor